MAGLRCESAVITQYEKALEGPQMRSKYSVHFNAVVLGFSYSAFVYANAACYYFGVYLITHSDPDELHIMDIFKVAIAVLNGGAMVGIACQGLIDFNKAFAAAESIFDLLDRVPEIVGNATDGVQLNTINGNAKLVDAEFAYPARPMIKIHRKLNLSIVQGEKIALVGPSGCGKSTVIQLIQRLYDVDNGCVEIDDYNIESLNVPNVRSKLGIVSQEPVLFNRSIADNIQYGDNSRSVSMEEVIDAAKKSNIHGFVAQLPQGYDTCVGGKGTQLSGGQKQRIAIARALIRYNCRQATTIALVLFLVRFWLIKLQPICFSLFSEILQFYY